MAGDEGGLWGGGEDGLDVLSIVPTSKEIVPIPGRCISAASRWQAAKLTFGGHLSRPARFMNP